MEESLEDKPVLREWSSQSHVVRQIPNTIQRGLFKQDLKLTCISALPDFLAIGTDQGVVYWFNRKSGELQSLHCENTACSITCVQVISSVEFMVAAGTNVGTVTVFQVPKALPDNLPDSLKKAVNRQVDRYTVDGLHTSPITAIEWSLNGTKLFSGDKQGVVVLTEIVFNMHLSKSFQLLNEQFEVVQLSYCPSQQRLALSTQYRSIVCHLDETENKWKIAQIGNKERKVLSKLGATFYYHPNSPRTPVILCARPGLRVWVADQNGTVQNTLIYKEALRSPHPRIPVLKSVPSRCEPHLGTLSPFKNGLFVSYTIDSLLVLDPESVSVSTALYDVPCITSVSVNKNEIFLIAGDRKVIRLAYEPEANFPVLSSSIVDQVPPTVSNAKSILLEITSKLRDISVVPTIPATRSSPDEEIEGFTEVGECVEALELPPVVELDDTELIPKLTVDFENYVEISNHSSRSDDGSSGKTAKTDAFEKISRQDFEDILYHPQKRYRKRKSKSLMISSAESGSDTTSLWSAASETEDFSNTERLDVSSDWSFTSNKTKPNHDNLQVASASAIEDCTTTSEGENPPQTVANGCTTVERPNRALFTLPLRTELPLRVARPEVENLDAIKRSVAINELVVAELYKLQSVLGVSRDDTTAPDPAPDSDPAPAEVDSTVEDLHSVGVPEEEESEDPKIGSSEPEVVGAEDNPESLDSLLSFDPPSGSSQIPNTVSAESGERILDSGTPLQEVKDVSGWLQFMTPAPITWITACNYYIAVGDSTGGVHYSILGGFGLKWQYADCKAGQLAMSTNADVVWRVHEGKAYALRNPAATGPHGEDREIGQEWLEVASDIRCVGVGDNAAWVVTNAGDIICYEELDRQLSTLTPSVLPREWPVVKIACFAQDVWTLTSLGEVYARTETCASNPKGKAWQRVNIPVPGSVQNIALGCQGAGWIVDNSNTVMFSVNYNEPDPLWWQIILSDYIYQRKSPLQQIRSCMTLKNLPSLPILPTRQQPVTLISSSSTSVWVAQRNENILHVNRSRFTGHRWVRIAPKTSVAVTSPKWQYVSSEGIFENKGQMWLLSVEGDLFCCRSNASLLKKVSLPASGGAVCIAASSQALWILMSSGEVHIRQGLNEMSLQGTKWRQLSLDQIAGVQLSHISCGSDVVWACDIHGSVYLAVVSPHAMATSALAPVWIQVDSKEQTKTMFVKVFVGPQTFMVWAIDNKGKVYVREAIFPDFQIGTGWVLVTGITAVNLTVSATAVWALSTDGDIYRRHGITQNNFIGDYWKKIPGSVEFLTASISDELWGIDKSGTLLHHKQLMMNLDPRNKTLSRTVSRVQSVPIGTEDSDWEVVESPE